MSGPAIIPGKRFNPWRYFMNSIFINRFSVVGLWFWISGMTMGIGAGTRNVYLLIGGMVAAWVGGWPAATWERDREGKQDLARWIAAEVDQSDETLDLDRRIVQGVRRIVGKIAGAQ